ncbi:SNF2 family helicase ATPase [Aspergillus sclerotialis]|uniref:SNF2 family helicase ATPase n=1 Tax=Aspergillus sclerotialis TaxID=2070753 RepID=A0A3A2ZF16_9EURO|nr:SNF2 family helicase ATPase [Aspergillus sclerotialis]
MASHSCNMTLAELDEQIENYRTLLENSDCDDNGELGAILSTFDALQNERARRTSQRTMANYSSPYRPVANSPLRNGSFNWNESPLRLRQGESSLLTNPSRKRPGDGDLLDLPGPSKRPASNGSHHGEFPASRRQSIGSNASEELLDFLGIDNPDELRMLMDEQEKAEQFLAQRKEEERKDAEIARRIQEGLIPSPRPYSAQSSSTSYSGSNVFNGLNSPPRAPANNSPSRINFSSFNPLGPSGISDIPAPTPFNPRESSRPNLPSVVSLLDSDESDVGEMPAPAFNRRQPLGSLGRPSDLPFGLSPYQRGMADARSLMGSPIGPGLGSGTRYGPNVLQSTMARVDAANQRLRRESDLLDPFDIAGPYPGLSSDFPLGAGPDPDSWRYDYYLREALRDSSKTNDEIKQLLETIRPDAEISKENREGTPDALIPPLLEHQKLGLSWMKTMEESEKKGGILADDMGLGKTIQALALMVSRQSTDPERKTTLIIAPVSLMQQWRYEIQRMLKPGRRLSVYVLHGERKRLSFPELKEYDVVLTTFGTLASEFKRKNKYEEYEAEGRGVDFVTLKNNLPVLGPLSKWYRVIIDEAQCIKNRNSKAAQACCRINSIYRWCMSGTPMMNNVEELYSLIKFLRIRPYCELERFSIAFTRPLKSQGSAAHSKAMRQLQVLLKAILLRRTKTSTIDGHPILQLPPRITEQVHAVFNEEEQQFYNTLEARSQNQFNRYLNSNTVGRNYSSILVLLLRLRQACCHPHLIQDFNGDGNANTSDLDLVANAKAFGEQVVIRLRDNQDQGLECPICIDAVENPIIFFPCGHSTCAECFSRISDPSISVRQGVDGLVVKCPNCRGQVDPKKITDHATFRKVHFPDPSAEPDIPTAEEPEPESDSDNDSDSDDSISKFIVNDEGEPSKSKSKSKGKGKAPKKQHKSLAELKKEGQRNLKAKKKYIRRLEKTWESSAKIDKAMEILEQIQNTGEKTIIFSQFTSLLDLLEIPVSQKGWGYRRYDGSMKPVDRDEAVMDFSHNPGTKIMLVSLKAGNSGLNLTAASQVILFDPFWNPYVEEQAIDRAHRIGQRREVNIHRILVKETVEDRILELQEKKRELIEGALDENAGRNLSRLGTRELAYLFGVQS